MVIDDKVLRPLTTGLLVLLMVASLALFLWGALDLFNRIWSYLW